MRLGVLTDAHLCPPGTPPDGCHNPYAYDRAASLLTAALAGHEADDVDVVCVLGDLSNGGDAESLFQAVDILSTANTPVMVVAGNHDRDKDPEHLARLIRAAKSHLAMPTPRGEKLAAARIVSLPIVKSTDDGWQVERPEPSQWEDRPVVVLCHLPVLDRRSEAKSANLKYAGGMIDETIAALMIERSAPSVVIHGHLHIRDACSRGSVLQIGCAALIEPPHERAVIDIVFGDRSLDVRVSHRAVAPSPPVRLPVMTESESTWTFESGRWSQTSMRDDQALID